MQEELGKHIASLLYHHDRLIIPGLGGFELSHAPALVDQVQGQVSAPTKAVTFNENLVLDDGLLVAHLQERNGWSAAEAQTWVRGRVERMRASLHNKEIVELPGVGRFFRNFEHQLKFVAESGNFNVDTYGLQPVEARLIARPREEKIPVAQAATGTVPPVREAAPRPAAATEWVRGNVIWVTALSLLVLFLAFLLLWPSAEEEPVSQPSDPVAEIPRERLNAGPSRSTPTPETLTPPVRELPPAPPEDMPEEIDTEAPTLANDEYTAVIAVGLFGDPGNAERMMERLAKDGYSPVSKREGGNTRVGASIRFTEEKELNNALRRIRRDYTKSAFLLSRDGKSVQ